MTRADKSFNVSDLDIIELLQLYWGEQIHPNKYKLYISQTFTLLIYIYIYISLDEIDAMIMTPEESQARRKIWNAMNKDWMEKQKLKAELEKSGISM